MANRKRIIELLQVRPDAAQPGGVDAQLVGGILPQVRNAYPTAAVLIRLTRLPGNIVFPDNSRISRFPSLAKEGWREAPGWFGMSASQAERL